MAFDRVDVIADNKRRYREIEREELEIHDRKMYELRRQQRRCFWTRPIGHVYNKGGYCVGCGKQVGGP